MTFARPLAIAARSSLLALGVLLAGLSSSPVRASASSDTPTELGLELIPWSKKLDERRYESPRDWEATIKFFRDKFKGWKTIKWTREVSLPAVKYLHITNAAEGGKWEGINIYALPDGRVRYFLLKRAAVPPATPAKPAAEKTSADKPSAGSEAAPKAAPKAPPG